MPCPALQLYEHVCDERQCTDIGCSNPGIPATVLLLPPEYELLDPGQLPALVQLLNVGELRGSPVGGLTFGAQVPEYKGRGKRLSYPSGPTWQVGTVMIITPAPWVMRYGMRCLWLHRLSPVCSILQPEDLESMLCPPLCAACPVALL